jgi:hypothetical protein
LRFLKGGFSDLMGEPFASSQVRVLFFVVIGHASFVKRYAI